MESGGRTSVLVALASENCQAGLDLDSNESGITME